jgi:hypothetical protein
MQAAERSPWLYTAWDRTEPSNGQTPQVGIALKPQTPVELVMPYVEAGLLDMVSGDLS